MGPKEHPHRERNRIVANSATLTLHTAAGEALRFDAVAGSGHATIVDSGTGMIAPSPIEALLIALAGT